MSTHLTRKELKHDNVALKVEETVDFLKVNRQQMVRYGGAALAVVVIVAGVFYYRSAQRDVRQQMLADALTLQSAPVGTAPPTGGPSFPSDAAKNDAVRRAFTKVIDEHGGSTEAYTAELSLATIDADAGKMSDARKRYQDIADHAPAGFASMAKLAIAQLDFSDNKTAEAQSILKDLQDHPTEMVSKNQATYTLAKGLAPTQPEEARKLLLTLVSAPSDVSQLAVTALGELPSK
ncbi:MAG TPA: tetratricopeptide repeat protein [Bryobacteraceae bacterium]|nr:tetratricopeptide repeat protein [Bryobacteraceae bacterium]